MEYLIHISLYILYLLYNTLEWFYKIIYRKKPPSIPKAKNPLLQLSATTLAKQIRQGEISSETLVQAYIDRIKEVNPTINAVVDERFEEALREARECDENIKLGKVNSQTLEYEKPLYGIPITVKESCSLKGLSYTGCTLARKNVKATENSAIVEATLKAGAIPLCVTNTPELCSSLHTANYVYGTTNNPYDVRRTSGGSSGGEGALIGAGASLIGIGSDLAGSIRVPAQFNCIFGHKPSPGIISIRGHYPEAPEGSDMDKFLVLGPLARYAEDLHLAMKVMTSDCKVNLRLDEPVSMKGLRVFYMDDIESCCNIRLPIPEIRKCIKDSVDYLGESGAAIQESPVQCLKDTFMTMLTAFLAMKSPQLLIDPENPQKEKRPGVELIKSLFGCSDYTKVVILTKILLNVRAFRSRSEIDKSQKIIENLREKITNLLKDDGVLIFPTYPTAACYKSLITLRIDCTIYCLTVNLLLLPATHVPIGFDKNNMPIGLQVIAGPNQDRLCLAVAKELQKKFGGWRPPVSN